MVKFSFCSYREPSQAANKPVSIASEASWVCDHHGHLQTHTHTHAFLHIVLKNIKVCKLYQKSQIELPFKTHTTNGRPDTESCHNRPVQTEQYSVITLERLSSPGCRAGQEDIGGELERARFLRGPHIYEPSGKCVSGPSVGQKQHSALQCLPV